MSGRIVCELPRESRAGRSSRAWTILCVVLLAGLAADILTKRWSFSTVADRPVVLQRHRLVSDPTYNPVPARATLVAVPRVLHIRLAINRGAVFGLGANHRLFFIAFTVAALAGGVYVFSNLSTDRTYHVHVAVGLFLAGGIGNLHDRIAFGAVRDFLQMMPSWRLPFGWTWPGGSPHLMPWVFNIADVMLLAGMVVLMTYLNRTRPYRWRKAEEEATERPGE
jgi:signal peptidase II